jgi:glycosyltransferase involved in cell wall biosynthesis
MRSEMSSDSEILLSVITCTHNPNAATLNRVWESLNAQTLCPGAWEYILVDNASREPLKEWLKSGCLRNSRCVREERLGLTPARLKGIAEARGEILVFVDDDCLLRPDYLEVVRTIFAENPRLGAVGGYGTAEYEVEPPDWMTRSLRNYLLDMRLPESGPSLVFACVDKVFGHWFPVGAGMAMRKPLATSYAESIRQDSVGGRLDRTGNELFGGGDLDMGIHCIGRGFAIGKSSDLRFTHVVPRSRLELDYMVRLMYMSQYSTEVLLIHRGWTAAVPKPKVPLVRSIKRRLIRPKPIPPDEQCWQAFAKGRMDGRAGDPPDPSYLKG